MPIEIRELHIKVTVNQPSSDSSSSAVTGPAAQDDKEALVSQCVEQVIELMNAKKER
jgi:hypothetical protein